MNIFLNFEGYKTKNYGQPNYMTDHVTLTKKHALLY